jgi:hypothetical protein
MTALSAILLASFTSPMQINTDPASTLWLVPLLITVVVVYKATKVYMIRPYPFVRECAVLLGSILVFIGVAALILYGAGWIVTDELPKLFDKAPF